MTYSPTHALQEFNASINEIDGLYHEFAKNVGLSDSAFHILYAMVQLGNGCLQVDIARNYFLSKQTINSAVRNLEKQGYITLHKGKGRDMHLNFTPKGELLVKEKIYLIFQIEDAILEAMTPEEVKAYMALSKKYATLLRQQLTQHFNTLNTISKEVTIHDDSVI